MYNSRDQMKDDEQVAAQESLASSAFFSAKK